MLDFASVSVCDEKYIHHDALGILEDSYCTCFALADGKEASKVADLAVQSVLADFREQSEITTATMPNFFEHAQRALTDFQTTEFIPGGTAMAVLLTNGEIAVWAHIGDCRIYHLQDRLLYEITPDHSDAYTRFEAGELRYPKIRTDRLRQNLHSLLGPDQNFSPTFSPPTVVRKNDSFLLCTDGFWENIHERQIERTLRHTKTAQGWLNKMQKIVQKNRASGKYTKRSDDYSAITIRI